MVPPFAVVSGTQRSEKVDFRMPLSLPRGVVDADGIWVISEKKKRVRLKAPRGFLLLTTYLTMKIPLHSM